MKGWDEKMKVVKQYKGFKIKEVSEKERQEWGWTCNYKLFNRDGEEEWETSTIEEAIEWINCY